MKTSELIILSIVLTMITFSSYSIKKPPTDADGRTLIVKTGTIDCDMVETSPVVF